MPHRVKQEKKKAQEAKFATNLYGFVLKEIKEIEQYSL